MSEFATDEEIQRAVTRALGQVIAEQRTRLGWTRAQLADVMRPDIHGRTIAGYETGQRHCNVSRFVEMCDAMNTSAPDLLGVALQRARQQLATIRLRVDLRAVADHPAPWFALLGQWARNRLAADPDGQGVAELSADTVSELAALLDVQHADLVSHLIACQPGSAGGQA